MSQHIRAFYERGLEDGTKVFVASSAGIKRDGLALEMAGAQIDHYLANPVVLWAHDYRGERLPIGRTTKLGLSKTKIRAHIIFDRADPFAREVDRKYEERFLSAVSIGWVDLERDQKTGTTTKWELLDISAVPVPGDPDALMEREMALLRSIVAERETDPADGQPLPTVEERDLGDGGARPVGPYPDWDACVADMIANGYSQEEAEKICGAIKEQAARAGEAQGRQPVEPPSAGAVPLPVIHVASSTSARTAESSAWFETGRNRKAIPPHTTAKADEDAPWDGPGTVAACPAERAKLRLIHAWVDDDADPDTKQAYKMPHHRVTGEVVWHGVAAAMARLLQAGTQIPDPDRAGVYRHLERHYRQFDKTPPEFRDAAGFPAEVVAGMFHYDEWRAYRQDLAADVDEKVDALAEAITAYKASKVPDDKPADDNAAEALAALAEALKEPE